MNPKHIMVGREFLKAANLFDEEVGPQIQKLKFLSLVSDNGILGEDYQDLSSGLSHILDDIYENLINYRAELNELLVLERERTERGEIIDPQGKLGPGKEKEENAKLHIEMAWDYLNKAFEEVEDKEKLLDSLRIWMEGARQEQKAPEIQPSQKDSPGA